MDEIILNPPINLTEEEKIVWDEFVTMLNSSTNYKKIMTDTAITNEFTKIQNVAKEELGFKNFYNKAPSLFNARAIEFFYEFLAKMGVKEVFYYSIRDKFLKHYGYFIKN